MARLDLSFLGRFHVTLDDKPITAFESDKVRALLAYLAVEVNRSHSRDVLAGLLWPEQTASRAHTNLRHALLKLRQVLGDREAAEPSLLVTSGTIQINPARELWIDVAAFTTLVETCRAHQHRSLRRCKPCRDRMQRAVSWYRGDFLQGLTLRDSEPFEEWAAMRREQLHQQALDLLYDLADHHEQHLEYALAQHYARRQLEFEPWREEAHRQLMRSLARSGRRSAALRQFQNCARLLAKELDAAPSDETRLLYEQIRAGRLAATAEAMAKRHNLPTPRTSFVGRERELVQLQELLATERLIAVAGTGGCGKTRLVLQAAADLVNSFRDGVWFVELAGLTDPATVLHAVAAVFQLVERDGGVSVERLVSHLRGQQALLILDNCEHVIEACASLVDQLLNHCPDLCIVATSREALRVSGETRFHLQPLSLPDGRGSDDDPVVVALRSEAVCLFVERAKEAQSSFGLTPRNARTVVELCRQLDGLPLALELVAAQIRVLTPEQMATRLGKRLRWPAREWRTAPPRHRTLGALVDWSYDLLAEPERRLFRRLAVFAGTFTIEAVERVGVDESSSEPGSASGDVLALLTMLVEKSLVTVEEHGEGTRFRLLETIRHYALDRLCESGEEQYVRSRHCDWCIEVAEHAKAWLWGASTMQQVWCRRLEVEHDNLRAALHWSLEHDSERGLRLAGALWLFWSARGYLSEGNQWLEELLARTPRAARWRATALVGAGTFARFLFDLERARARCEESIPLLDAIGDRQGLAWARHNLGIVAWFHGDHAAALRLLDEGRALSEAIGDRATRATILRDLGALALSEGDRVRARTCYEESLKHLRATGDREGTAATAVFLGSLVGLEGDVEQARALHEEGLELAREIGQRWSEGSHLIYLGELARREGDYERASALLEGGVTIFRERDVNENLAWALGFLGRLAGSEGDYRRARAIFDEVLTLLRAVEGGHGTGQALAQLGNLARHEGDLPRARTLLVKSLTLLSGTRRKPDVARSLWFLGMLDVREGRFDRGIRFIGAATNANRLLVNSLDPRERADYASVLAAAREALDEHGYAARMAEGEAMTLEQAIAEVLVETTGV